MRRHHVVGPLLAVLVGCSGEAPAGPPPGPPPPPSAQPRTYAMGWGLTPPKPTEESIIATAMAMSQVAEFGIIQQAVPWARLFAGATIEEMVAETKGLAAPGAWSASFPPSTSRKTSSGRQSTRC